MSATTNNVTSLSDVKAGAFVRKDSVFRNFITRDGSSGFPPERDRYHLYVSLACPWAHRTLIMRALKGLQDVITVNVVDWFMPEETGWRFNPEVAGATPDTVHGYRLMREVYHNADPEYTGRITVPVLYDKKTNKIVNNESSEIIRMLNTEFNEFCATDAQRALDFYPENLRPAINEINDFVYPNINNGVYRAGFAGTQEVYEAAARDVFNALDRLEGILGEKRYLTGNQLTEADIRLFTTLIRFDPVYHGHFKCNLRMLRDYTNVYAYMREIYQIPAIKETVNFTHIKSHYYYSHSLLNPKRIVPIGPIQNLDEPHGRERLSSA